MNDNSPEPSHPGEPPAPPPHQPGQPSHPSQPAAQPPASGNPPSGAAYVWGGVGVGCGTYLLFGLLMLALISMEIITGAFSLILYFLVPALVGAVLLCFVPTRRWGIGVLIAAAAAWLTVIGPCLAILTDFGRSF